jgi:hypothetical protein
VKSRSSVHPIIGSSVGLFFSTVGAVKNHPRIEIVCKLLKPVDLARRREQYISRPERLSRFAIHKNSFTLHDDVEFILSVWLLRIAGPRRIKIDAQSSATEDFGKAPVAFGNHLYRITKQETALG